MALGALTMLPKPAMGLPIWARRYNISCQKCHNPFPKLSRFGEEFAANGYRTKPGTEQPDTSAIGDSLLTLPSVLPLALRADGYVQGYANGKAVTDFQAPYLVKLLSNATLGPSISYYIYAVLLEQGEAGSIEDAFLYFNDIGGRPLDVALGQFQVSDAMFKRELRLELEDYAVYRARIGDVPYDLTYDRGIGATADLLGFALAASIVNGNGIGPANSNGRFDVDSKKNLFLRIGRSFGKAGRFGVLGYYGQAVGGGRTNETGMFGVDASLPVGIVELNGQLLHRRDSDPTFTAGGPTAVLNGGFGELIIRPARSRWYGFALYNLVRVDQPLLDVGLGLPGGLTRYHSIAGGFGHLARRNLRLTGEVGYDIEQDAGRISLGFVLAY